MSTIPASDGDGAAEQARLDAAGYQPPSEAPFKCGHCRFFMAEVSRCRKPEVRAAVKAEGCCDYYKKTAR